MSLRSVVTLLLISFLLPAAAEPPEGTPEVWMSMRHGVPDLVGDGSDWAFVLNHLDGLKFMRSNLFTYATPEDVRGVCALLNKAGADANIEVSGPTPLGPPYDDLGVRSGKQDLERYIEPVAEAGSEPHFLDVDWQVHHLRDTLSKARPELNEGAIYDQCMDLFVDYIKTVRAKHPGTEFFLLSNFPNWRWRGEKANTKANWGDYWEVVRRAVPRCREAGVPLRGVTVDFPYGYIVREGDIDWFERVRAFERYARSEGLDFNLIINCQEGGNNSDALFSRNTLKYLERYQAAGGRPDRYIVQSWYDYPKSIVPEDKPYTMTHLVAEVLRRVKGLE